MIFLIFLERTVSTYNINKKIKLIHYLQLIWSVELVQQKRSKISNEQKCREVLQKRYPTGASIREDQSSTQSHLSAIGNELSKAKPRDSVLLPLMKSTYPSQRLFVLNEAVCARQILEVYPALKRPTIVRTFSYTLYLQ